VPEFPGRNAVGPAVSGIKRVYISTAEYLKPALFAIVRQNRPCARERAIVEAFCYCLACNFSDLLVSVLVSVGFSISFAMLPRAAQSLRTTMLTEAVWLWAILAVMRSCSEWFNGAAISPRGHYESAALTAELQAQHACNILH
jgi:hypothetical protein